MMDRETTGVAQQDNLGDQLSVVCFGASSGGFEAYCTILSLLPSDTGMAYIIVHHQPAEGKSLLVDILPSMTDMPVVLVSDGKRVQANHVYVVPAGKQVTMNGDDFHLAPLVKTRGWPKNISIFLQSLAEDRQKRAIAVILSGFDSDGAAALESIKKAGGLVFAQEFRTARQPDMPQSAVKTGYVDRLLPPAEIAAQLGRIGEERARHRATEASSPKGAGSSKNEKAVRSAKQQPPAAAGAKGRDTGVEPISDRFPAQEEQEVALTFFAPAANVVQVAGTFNDWNPAANPLEHEGSGEWAAHLMLKSGVYEYRFVVDGAWVDDPQAEQRAGNFFGGFNSILKVGLDDRADFL